MITTTNPAPRNDDIGGGQPHDIEIFAHAKQCKQCDDAIWKDEPFTMCAVGFAITVELVKEDLAKGGKVCF